MSGRLSRNHTRANKRTESQYPTHEKAHHHLLQIVCLTKRNRTLLFVFCCIVLFFFLDRFYVLQICCKLVLCVSNLFFFKNELFLREKNGV